jgi:hypothetical protein
MGLHPDLRGRRYLVLPTGNSVFVVMKGTEPGGDLAGLIVLEELVDTAAA